EALHVDAALDTRQRATIAAARSIYEFDDRITAPINGFSGAEEYYAFCSSRRFLAAIATPTLIIHALDDPWIPGWAYQTVAWEANPNRVPLISRAGGHVGFHGVGSWTPWHDQCVAQFFAETLVESADQNSPYLKQLIT